MEKRRLGNSWLEIRPLAFGGNVFGWTADEPNSFQLLDAFVGAGFDFIDTADVYSHWVPGRKGLSKSYIRRAAEDSLKRLQTDYFDLYQSHADDPETPLEETLEAFGRLIREGKMLAIGASNYGAKRLSQSLEASGKSGLPSYQSLQPLSNLYDRSEYEADLEPLCLERRLGVLCYSPLASGFLTGKYRSEKDLSGRTRAEFVKKCLDDRGFRILGAMDRVAEKHRSTPAAVALPG